MPFTTLIDTATLATRLDDPDTVIVDSRFELSDAAAGERAYEQAHISGAVYAHIDRDLSGTKTGTNGRHPLPPVDTLIDTLGRLGVDSRAQVVVYDQDTGMFAVRLWWLLRWMGHSAVAVLDGGFAKWMAEQRPTRAGVETRPPRAFVGGPRKDFTANADEVARLAGSPDARVLDARAPERYRGDVEPLDPVAGHIPGAASHFYMRNIEAGVFKSPEQLRAEFAVSTGGIAADRIVCYCGSGVTACHNLLALEVAGLHGARLYPGSWSEWVADKTRPVATGGNP
jgi:thiosulfate/3-mercaptopyruvate sulfurtransferase